MEGAVVSADFGRDGGGLSHRGKAAKRMDKASREPTRRDERQMRESEEGRCAHLSGCAIGDLKINWNWYMYWYENAKSMSMSMSPFVVDVDNKFFGAVEDLREFTQSFRFVSICGQT